MRALIKTLVLIMTDYSVNLLQNFVHNADLYAVVFWHFEPKL